MKVCIAEKPSVAREIANVLGARNRKDGYIEGNGYAVTWTFGHFCGLYSPDDYVVEWKKWNLNTLPMLPEKFKTKLINDKGVKKQFSVIKKLFKKATLVINCGDAGQEGELIQRWVLNEAKYKGEVQRLWISSLTKEAIASGMKDLRPASDYDRLYFAGSARAIGDWLLGMNGTRLYTLRYGKGKAVLSVGRVQTPTLAMLVARHKQIINFVSSPFWELFTNYRGISFKSEKGRFLKKDDGENILKKINGQPFTIISSTKKNGKEYAPKLFDLTSLQIHCNKRFGFSADRTLKIVQKLYELKAVTYPRVDTTYLPNDVYPKIKGILSKLSKYVEFTDPLLSKPIKKSSRVFNNKKVTDHHAIIPTGVQARLDYDQERVYDAITRRFIANFYPECLVNNTVVIGESVGEKFKTKGKVIVHPGWKVLYPPKPKQHDKPSENEENVLPIFKPGETGPHKPTLIEKQTQPPKYYTEATLLQAMETAGKTVDDEEMKELMKENGIGRPSTRASIIETLYRRKYAYRSKKNILATDLGIQLIDTIHNPLLTSVELTGQWEQKLRQIEAGQYQIQTFIKEMKAMTKKLVSEVIASNAPSKIDVSNFENRNDKKYKNKRAYSKLPKPKAKTPSSNQNNKKTKSVSGSTCPKCNKGNLIKGKEAFGCTQWKGGCTFRLPFKYKGKKISENQYIRLITKGCTVSLKGFIENGVKVNGLIRFDNQYGLVLEQPKMSPIARTSSPKSESMTCPKCGKGTVIKGKTAYGCSNWKSGCDFRYSFVEVKNKVGTKKITPNLIRKILSAGPSQ